MPDSNITTLTAPQIVILHKAKETKGTWVYEADDTNLAPALKSIYVPKHVVAALGSPTSIKVSVECA